MSITISLPKEKSVVAAFDFDGTLTTGDTLIAFIRFTHGWWRMFAGFLLHAHHLVAMKLGLYPNWKAKEKVFAFFYKGTPYTQFAQWGREFTEVVETMLDSRTVALLRQHQAKGHAVCVVTASVGEWVRPVCNQLGVTLVLSTCVEVSADGLLTGCFLPRCTKPTDGLPKTRNTLGSSRSSRPLDPSKNCYGAEKVARLLEAFPDRENYILYAYGDSRGDDELLAFADRDSRIDHHNRKRL